MVLKALNYYWFIRMLCPTLLSGDNKWEYLKLWQKKRQKAKAKTKTKNKIKKTSPPPKKNKQINKQPKRVEAEVI